MAYETLDGRVHRDERAALRHAEERHDAILSSLAHRLVHVQKYTELRAFIEANLDEFVQLKELKMDMEIIDET